MGFEEVNFISVLVATVLAFILGGLWYSALLFARQWTAAHGYSEEKVKQLQQGAAPSYAIAFVCWFVMATALALVAPHFGQGVGGMLHMALLLWVGFSATKGLTHNRFSDEPLSLWLIDAGHQIASLTVMAAVLGLWS